MAKKYVLQFSEKIDPGEEFTRPKLFDMKLAQRINASSKLCKFICEYLFIILYQSHIVSDLGKYRILHKQLCRDTTIIFTQQQMIYLNNNSNRMKYIFAISESTMGTGKVQSIRKD